MPLFGASDIFRLQRKGKTDKLIKALRHAQADIREAAAVALGELGNMSAVVPLIISLDDWNIDVRTAAIEALGNIRDSRAVDSLVHALRERSIRTKALDALMKIGNPAITPLLEMLPKSNKELQLQIIEVLGKVGSRRSIDSLIECLKERDRDLQDAAATALVSIGKPAVSALSELLSDRRKAVRGAAVKIIGFIDDPSAVEVLVPLLKDENFHVRQLVVQALDQFGWKPDQSQSGSSYWVIKKEWNNPEEAEYSLLNAVNDDLVEIRIAAVRELVNVRTQKAVDALITALHDDELQVRLAAVESLGNLEDTVVIEPLLSVIQDWHPRLSVEAARALQRFGHTVTGSLTGLLEEGEKDIRRLAAETLGNIGDLQAMIPLIGSLSDREPEVIRASIEALGKIGDPGALEPILTFVQSPDEKIREMTAMALGNIGEHLATASLLDLLKDEVETVRLATARALGQICDPASVESLINALNDSSLRVREAAAQAIGGMGSVAVKPLIAILGDWDKDIQSIRKALTNIGAAAIRPLIPALASSEDKVSEAAAKVLDSLGWQPSNDEAGASYFIAKKQWMKTVRIGPPAVKPLILALQDADVWVRIGSAEALGNIGGGEAVPSLINLFYDKYWNVRDAAAEALVKIGEPAVDPLVTILKQRHPATIEYAARALGMIGDVRAIEPLNDALFDEYKRVRRAAAGALEKMGALHSGRRCTNCGKPVPRNYRTGDSCPFCEEFLDI